MKIDFDASYKDVAHLLRAPASGKSVKADGSSFDKALDAAAPSTGQSIENTESLMSSIKGPGMPEEPRARLQFEPPGLMSHELERVQPPQTPVVKDQTPGTSVKTPTVVEAKRIQVKAGTKAVSAAEIAHVKDLVSAAGFKHGVDPALAMAMVKNESSFNARAVSTDGAESKGLFQLLDSTGKGMLEKTGLESSYDPFNPEMNVDLGMSYLRYLHDIFSSSTGLPNKQQTKAAGDPASLEKIAVAAFNAGEGRVASAQGRAAAAGRDPSTYSNIEPYLPRITQEYVSRVMASKEKFSE